MTLTTNDVWSHLDSLTKPPRSLGRLEDLAHRLCMIQQSLVPRTKPRRLVLFAADHGVVSAGVSAWPQEVTSAMVRTICAGKAASTVLAQESGTETVLVNIGVLEAALGKTTIDVVDSRIQYRDVRFCDGTRNLAVEPALSLDEFETAFELGRQEANAADRDGMRVVAVGEMGIGNTTPAACLAMLLANTPLQDAVGRGAGADDVTMERKRQVVQSAVDRSRKRLRADPRAAIAGVAGLEIAAMAGFYAAAHSAGLTILLDGYVASAAALIADHLQPGTVASMIAAHRSAEPGHSFVLEHLRLQAFFDWKMRLGEGTGALLLLPMLDAAAKMTSEMATLESLKSSKTPGLQSCND
jgi:nicotinate-nucleotide--dimethylbenzimidazole phosphoribosyltransferase